MRKLFTMILVMAAAIAFLAGSVAAQSGSTTVDKEQLKKLNEFMKDSKVKPSGADVAVPPKTAQKPAVQTPAKPAVQPPAKLSVQPKPVVQAVDKSKVTYVGKVSEKMSPERKACMDKCEAGRPSCQKRCAEGEKTRDIYVVNDCVSCQNNIIACQKRCPAK